MQKRLSVWANTISNTADTMLSVAPAYYPLAFEITLRRKSQMTQPSRIVWFEIPTADLDRAITFYSTVLDLPLKREVFQSDNLAVFPYERPAVSGCLIETTKAKPSQDGVAIYLNCDGKLDGALERTPAAGGSVLAPKEALPPGMGFVAQIVDSEGNRIGLHSAI
jgi:predicted enzyme related to lactoylglutathione lyase